MAQEKKKFKSVSIQGPISSMLIKTLTLGAYFRFLFIGGYNNRILVTVLSSS